MNFFRTKSLENSPFKAKFELTNPALVIKLTGFEPCEVLRDLRYFECIVMHFIVCLKTFNS